MSNLHFVETPAAGRLALMPAPQRADFRTMAKAGIALVVSLLPVAEAERLALAAEARLCRQAGFDFVNFPIADFAVPEDFGAAAALVGAIADQLAGGDAVAIHCRAGIGRSGMFASAVLVALGETPDAAMAAVSAARGCDVPETEAQRAWVRDFAVYAAERVTAGG